MILAALVALWGILTFFDIDKQPSSGYATDGNNTVTQVEQGGQFP